MINIPAAMFVEGLVANTTLYKPAALFVPVVCLAFKLTLPGKALKPMVVLASVVVAFCDKVTVAPATLTTNVLLGRLNP